MPQPKKAIIFDWIGTLSDRNTGLYPFSKDVLEECRLKGYKLALVSKRANPEKGREELRNYGLEKYFDVIIIDTEKEIPQFERCLEQLGINPSGVIVVGDRTIREIRIGNQLGCTTIWIEKGEHENETPNSETGQPTYRVQSIKDITQLI